MTKGTGFCLVSYLCLLFPATGLRAAGQEYATNFEDQGSGWSFQWISSQAQWKVDATPLVFLSPTSKLDNMDAVDQLPDSSLGATATSPPAFLTDKAERFVGFWCYTVMNSDITPVQGQQGLTFGSSRMLRIGPDPLTSPEYTETFFFAVGAYDWTNNEGNPLVPGAPGVIFCPGEYVWHKHVIATDPTLAQELGAGVIVTPFARPEEIRERLTLRAEFGFRFGRYKTFAGNPPAEVTYKAAPYWAIDDLRVADTLYSPFGPQPERPGARRGTETGGSSEGCGTTSVELFRPPGGGPGPGGVLLLLAVAAVLWPLRLYLPRLRFERQRVE